MNLEQEMKELETLQQQLIDIEKEKSDELEAIKDKWTAVAEEIEEIPLNPTKKDIYLEVFSCLWMPYYVYDDNGRQREVKAYDDRL